MLAVGNGPVRLFRNNVGTALFTGNQDAAARMLNSQGFAVHRVKYGLCPGSSDLIGWRSVIITPDMIGQRLAVFLAVEVKTQHGRISPAQTTFLQAVNGSGGIGGVARSVEGARILIRGNAK